MSVRDGVGAFVIGNLVAGFGCVVGLFCGSFVGKSDFGKLVEGAAVGNWLVGTDCGCLAGTDVVVICGIWEGDNVTTVRGAATGVFVGMEDERKGDPVGGSEIPLFGRFVVVAVGLPTGDAVIGTMIGLAVGLSLVGILGVSVEGASVGRRVPTFAGACVGAICGCFVGTVVEIPCGFGVGRNVTSVGLVIGDCVGGNVVGKLVEGDRVIVIGRLVGSIFGDCVGDSVVDVGSGA